MTGGGFNAELTANREKTDKPMTGVAGKWLIKDNSNGNEVVSHGRRLKINGNV